MEQERVIIKRLRLATGLSAKATACLISKSAGWLSEIENGTGRSVLRPRDYKKIYDLLNGDKYKRHFGAWMKQANANKTLQRQSQSMEGAPKFFRIVDVLNKTSRGLFSIDPNFFRQVI